MSRYSLSRLMGMLLMVGAIVGLVGLLVRPMADDPRNVEQVLQLYAANVGSFKAHAFLTPVGWLLILAGVLGVCRGVPRVGGLRWADLAMYTTAVFTVLGLIGPTLDGILMPAVAGTGVEQSTAEAMFVYNEAIAARFALAYALNCLHHPDQPIAFSRRFAAASAKGVSTA